MQTDLLPYADEGISFFIPAHYRVRFCRDGKSMDAPHFSRLVDHLEDQT